MPTPSALRNALPTLLLATGLLAVTGCDRDQVSRSAPAPQGPAAAPVAMPPAMPGAAPGGMSGEVPPPPTPNAPLKWTLPKGWTSAAAGGMRFATLTPPGPGKAEVSVVVLPGAAGGEAANVNRWRGQIGLPPMDDAGLAAARQTVKCKAGTVAVFDFTSQGQAQSRMVCGTLVTQDGNTWFLKLMGDAPAVTNARKDYLRLLETLHLD